MRFQKILNLRKIVRAAGAGTVVSTSPESSQSTPENKATSEDSRSTLIVDTEMSSVRLPPSNGGSSILNAIPSIIGHTTTGYAFTLENAEYGR